MLFCKKKKKKFIIKSVKCNQCSHYWYKVQKQDVVIFFFFN